MKRICNTILVTGGSSGIGAAVCSMLADDGMTVYAASRSGRSPRPDAPGIIPASVDINDSASIISAIGRIKEEKGNLDAIVCCAGNGIGGAIEDTSSEEARYQFETNFFGTDNCIKAVLPLFRSQGHGRIITVTSVAGFIPIPYQGYYSSVKAALDMYMKALAIECRRFGIQCCSVMPGDVKTGFTSARKRTAASQSPDSPYYAQSQKSIAKMEHDEQNGMPPSRIARAIKRQLGRKHMKFTVVPRLDYSAIRVLERLLPTKLLLWAVGLLYDN